MANFIVLVKTGGADMIVNVPALNLPEAVEKVLKSKALTSNGLKENSIKSIAELKSDDVSVISWGNLV